MTEEKLIPIADRLLLKKAFYENKVGDILIIQKNAQKDTEAHVIAVGPEVTHEWDEGDLVVIMKDCGFPVVRGEHTEDETEYLCVREDEVLLKVK